jgi:hypothetical protein
MKQMIGGGGAGETPIEQTVKMDGWRRKMYEKRKLRDGISLQYDRVMKLRNWRDFNDYSW